MPEKPLPGDAGNLRSGYGCAYLNGKAVSEDLFIAPVSDYRRTLWYTIYDVTVFVQKGDNVFAAILGNGFTMSRCTQCGVWIGHHGEPNPS